MDGYYSNRGMMAENMEATIDIIDAILKSKTKRHIVGGILISVSILFAGLAITAMTLRDNDKT